MPNTVIRPSIHIQLMAIGKKDMIVFIHRENILTGETECEGYKVLYSQISAIGIKHKNKKTEDKKFISKYAVFSLCFGKEVEMPILVNSLTGNQYIAKAINFIESKIK